MRGCFVLEVAFVIPSGVEESFTIHLFARDARKNPRSFSRLRMTNFDYAYHIRSGTLIPRRSRPRCKTRAVRSHSARRELSAGSSDFNTGQAS